MEKKTKKTKVDYVAIIREYEMYARGRSLKRKPPIQRKVA